MSCREISICSSGRSSRQHSSRRTHLGCKSWVGEAEQDEVERQIRPTFELRCLPRVRPPTSTQRCGVQKTPSPSAFPPTTWSI